MYGVLADQQNVGLSSAEAYIRHSEDTYLHTPEELGADLFGIYLFDPAYAKRIMPNATRLVQLMQKPTLTFYSIPFASLLAAILANMAVADGEEEDQRAALALGRGALTA